MAVNKKNRRLLNEIRHGELIADKAEQIWYWSSPAGKVRVKRRCDMLKKFIGNNNQRVLELGCGTGIFTKEIAKTRNKIYAIDISNRLLLKARKRVPANNVKFKLEDAHKTKFQDNYFDYIVGNSILHHLDLDLAIKEIYRLLKPGGQFILTEPNMLNPQILLERNIPFIRRIANNSPNETAFIRWSLKSQLLKQGFVNVAIKPYDFLHPFTPASLIGVVSQLSKLLEEVPLLREIAGSLIITGAKSDDNLRLRKYQKIWQNKKILRDIYTDWYRQIVKDLNPGKTLELGSGIGNLKKYQPDIITSDIVNCNWLDKCFDAHKIPYANNSLSNLVMIDVLHHLENPIKFLHEAHRVLKPGGRLILNEPFPSPVSPLICKLFHSEPYIFNQDYFSQSASNSQNQTPWSANQAIPFLLFFKQSDKFHRIFGKKFHIIKKDKFSFLAYPLSGGFERRQLIPDSFFPLAQALEKLLSPLKDLLAFRCYLVLVKK